MVRSFPEDGPPPGKPANRAREMGVVDALRFLNQLRPGSGDYTKERGLWLNELSLGKIVSEIKAGRRRRRTSRRSR
jgi:hypothetical protein